MKKMKVFIFTITVMILLSFSGYSAVAHSERYLEMDIPYGFEKIEDEENYTTDIYINASAGQQISVTDNFNFDDINYSGLYDYQIKQIENDSDAIFIPEGSNNYFISEPEATRIYANSVEGGEIDGVRIHACYFDTPMNMEVFSTVYLFSVEDHNYGISFVSFDNSEYWYKECLDSLILGDHISMKYGITTTASEKNYQETYTEKTSSDFSPADFFEGLGTICGIALIIYLIYRALFKKK